MSEISFQVDESLALERLESDESPSGSGNDSLQRERFDAPPAREQTATSLAKRGDAHRLRGDHAAAIADYSAALRLDSNLVSAHINRGLAHWLSGQAPPAIDDF